MQRNLVLTLLVALFAGLGLWWWFHDGSAAPPTPIDSGTATAPATTVDAVAQRTTPEHGGEDTAGPQRQIVAAAGDLLDDPDIRSSLAGFRGRVVDHRHVPVAGCGVRIYRGGVDSIFREGLDLFADTATWAPQYVAGETQTAEDGTFAIAGVLPRGFHLLFAGIGTDAPMHQVLSRSPSPGEIVDLGDVVLPDSAVLTGTVLGDDGAPLAGALVCSADLPGSLMVVMPAERFDPRGAILIRERGSPVQVIELPAWVQRAFDDLPLPKTLTDADGRFRLVGVTPGSNLLATTCSGYLSDLKPSVQARAGQTKDVGRIVMKRGEELVGKVLDTKGEPVADAEVLAGSTLNSVPFDFAQRLGKTGADGAFTGQGFAPGRVTVAARRGPGSAWVLAEPQSIAGDVVVTLPATFAVAVTVVAADGQPIASPRFRLLQGRAGRGAAEMALLGFAPPVDLRDRLHHRDDGTWQIANLLQGEYTLLADAPGFATAFATCAIGDRDVAVRLELTAPQAFLVRVVDAADQPIRNASVYGEARGKDRLLDMPMHCGRTGRDGRLTIDKLRGETLKVSVDHPKWGTVGGEAKPGEELVLVLGAPGLLDGKLLEGGRPALPGKFSVTLMRQPGDGRNDMGFAMPQLLTADAEGAFRATLQSGNYELVVVESLEAIRSPGGFMGFFESMWMKRSEQRTEFEITAGQTTRVQIEAGAKPIEGPVARLTGTVFLNGQPAFGNSVSINGIDFRAGTHVDENGRFDFEQVPVASKPVLTVFGRNTASGMLMDPLWTRQLELTEGETRDLPIEITTSSIHGVCVDANGRPVAGVRVRAAGRLKDEGRNVSALRTVSDADGAFAFPQVPEGNWRVQANGGEPPGVGSTPEFDLTIGSPVDDLRIVMQATVAVAGRIDLAALGPSSGERDWVWLRLERLDEAKGDSGGGLGTNVDRSTGVFTVRGVTPGRYRPILQSQGASYECAELVVPANGLTDVVVAIVRKRE